MKDFTQADLDALPESKERVVFRSEEDGPNWVIDLQDQRWEIGWYKGKRWKRKCPLPVSIPQVKTVGYVRPDTGPYGAFYCPLCYGEKFGKDRDHRALILENDPNYPLGAACHVCKVNLIPVPEKK